MTRTWSACQLQSEQTRPARKSLLPGPGRGIAGRALRTHGTLPNGRHACRLRSLGNLRLIPPDVGWDSDHQIRAAGQGLSILILFVFRGGHYPDVTVVVAAELPFRIRSVESGREQAARAESSYKIFVVVPIHGEILFDRP